MDNSLVPSAEERAAVELKCARCSRAILICRSCWRNQSYCSSQCAREAHLARHRVNQKVYSQTEVAREKKRARDKAWRLRQKNSD
jgi:hypothetical protein